MRTGDADAAASRAYIRNAKLTGGTFSGVLFRRFGCAFFGALFCRFGDAFSGLLFCRFGCGMRFVLYQRCNMLDRFFYERFGVGLRNEHVFCDDKIEFVEFFVPRDIGDRESRFTQIDGGRKGGVLRIGHIVVSVRE